MFAEAAHESGREGVLYAKEWLERTGTVTVPTAAGDSLFGGALGTALGNGHYRYFDLLGFFYGRRQRPFFAEVKHYTNQAPSAEYESFLALAYCSSLSPLGENADYMFITWHPFSIKRWSTLRSAASVREAIESREEWLPPNSAISEAACQSVASRLWIIVLSERSVHLQLPLRLAKRVFADLETEAFQQYRSWGET